MITQAEVKNLFNYDPSTGILTRKITVNNRSIAGSVVGSTHSAGYLSVRIRYKLYFVHRIIWLLVHGEFPENVIDHINGICDDNRLANLRAVAKQDNYKNTKLRSNNKSGVVGVYQNIHGSWIAQIKVDYKQRYIGTFKDFDDAVVARKLAEEKYNFHPNHGRVGAEV